MNDSFDQQRSYQDLYYAVHSIDPWRILESPEDLANLGYEIANHFRAADLEGKIMLQNIRGPIRQSYLRAYKTTDSTHPLSALQSGIMAGIGPIHLKVGNMVSDSPVKERPSVQDEPKEGQVDKGEGMESPQDVDQLLSDYINLWNKIQAMVVHRTLPLKGSLPVPRQVPYLVYNKEAGTATIKNKEVSGQSDLPPNERAMR
jgi:hypothetical protein